MDLIPVESHRTKKKAKRKKKEKWNKIISGRYVTDIASLAKHFQSFSIVFHAFQSSLILTTPDPFCFITTF